MTNDLRAWRRRILGGVGASTAAFMALHAVHLAAVAGVPVAYQFLCHIGR
jgi:hypothetical protein